MTISWKYLAGLVDGEGNIGRYSASMNTTHRRLHLEVGMTCYRTIKALHDQFGGQFREVKTPDGRKAQWRWRVVSKKAVIILKEIQPHMITKAELVSSLLDE